MPELEFLHALEVPIHHPVLYGWCTWELDAIKAWPLDERKRTTFLIAMFRVVQMEIENMPLEARQSPELIRGLDVITRRVGGWATIAEAPTQTTVVKEYERRQWQGQLVGWLLVFVYAIRTGPQSQQNRATLRQAMHLLERWAEELVGRPLKAGEARAAWDGLKASAHLWAADIYTALVTAPRENLFDMEDSLESFDPDSIDLRRLLEYAWHFQEFGLGLVPLRSEKTLLDPESLWTVPPQGLWTESIPAIHLNQAIRNSLEAYEY